VDQREKEPRLTSLTPVVAIHLGATLSALVIGGINLARAKGTAPHKHLGRVWVIFMAVAAFFSFWINGFAGGRGFGPIHLLSVWTLIALACGVLFIRRGHRRVHLGFMIGTYVGLLGAGLGALAPGRLLNSALFGP
jgi:uncharacterized membrane protein